MTPLESIIQLRKNVEKTIVGQTEIVDRLIIGMLANGNLLVEGLPGLAKTRAVKALSKYIESDFNRIQFTPDLKAYDITGRVVFHEVDGKSIPEFEKGPVFANIVLADEINRAPSKVQNSLLEAMEERQVTVSSKTYKMPDLFLVMATMNPSTQEGTFPMPEAQLDRFLMHVTVHYPDEEAEGNIIRLVREEQSQGEKTQKRTEEVERVPQSVIFQARSEIDVIEVPPEVEKFMVDLVFATRFPQRYNYELKSYIACGASPRGSLALDRCTRAHAWLNGRSTATGEDVLGIVHSVLRHRIALSERSTKHKITSDELIDDILELIPAPQ